MDVQSAKKSIKILTVVWIVAGLLLVAAVFGGLLEKEVFQWTFAGGFVIYAVLTSVLTQIIHNYRE